MGKNNLERIYLAYVSWIIVHWGKPRPEVKPGGNLEAEADAEGMEEAAYKPVPAFLSFFFF